MLPRTLLAIALALACAAVAAADAPRTHTASPSVRVYTPPLRYPVLAYARTLRVYLPPQFDRARRYPVIYMFDGQNLFDDATSFLNEWGVDESLDALAKEQGFGAIVVGIDNGGELRFNELIPYWNMRFVPNQGQGFIDDVVLAIKPFVDANYPTLRDRSHTAIAGSSLGGLEADYALHRYPQVFGLGGVFSPSYWVSDDAFAQAESEPLPPGTRVFLYMGGKEGEDSVPLMQHMAQTLRLQPGVAAGVAVHVEAEAEHNERAWRKVFPMAVRWLFRLDEAAQERTQRR